MSLMKFGFFLCSFLVPLICSSQYFEQIFAASLLNIPANQEFLHLRAFDEDRDGDQDLIIFTLPSEQDQGWQVSHLYFCENNGINFSAAVEIGSTHLVAEDVFFEDMDQDGHLDLVYSGSSFNDLLESGCYWRPHDLQLGWADHSLWESSLSYYYKNLIADFNNDGFPDAIHSDTDRETGQLWLSNIQGDLEHAGYFNMPAASFNGYEALDVDDDGDLDLVSPGTSWGVNPDLGFYLRLNDGDGHFSEAFELVEGSWKLDQMLFLDFDQDTWLDALSWNVSDNEVLLISNLNEEGNSVSVDLPLAPVDVLFNADFNGNGYDELLKVDDTSMSVLEIQNGELTSVYSKVIPQNQILEFVVDVDEDGYPDVIAIDQANQNALVYRNTFHEYGCTDEAACNFNPDAIFSGSCTNNCALTVDLNGNGSVDAGDLLLLLQDFGCFEGNCASDFDQNGIVATEDLLLFLTWFGSIY